MKRNKKAKKIRKKKGSIRVISTTRLHTLLLPPVAYQRGHLPRPFPTPKRGWNTHLVWSAALPLVETLTFDHLREQRGHYSRIRLWGSVGFIVAVLATGAVLDVLPLNGVLWVCCAILAGILLLALLVPESPPVEHPHDALPIGRILKQPRVIALMASSFAMSAAHGALYVFYSIHLTDNGYSKTEVGLLWSLGVVAEIVVFMLMPRLSRHFTLRALLLASFAVAVVRFVMIGWGVASLWVAFAAQLMHGMTFGAHHAASIASVNQWFPGRAQGRGQAL